jgi:hypothetical protein
MTKDVTAFNVSILGLKYGRKNTNEKKAEWTKERNK